MNTIRKIKRSTKALSPVVASIILIAVTVAVSIAVAAWMGALTVGFMGSNSVTVTTMQFIGSSGGDPNNITVALKNTGTKEVTIATIKVNNVVIPNTDTSGAMTVAAAGTTTIYIELATADGTNPWTSGNAYKVDFYDTNNQVVGSFQQTAV
jgi:flagellin-like protein